MNTTFPALVAKFQKLSSTRRTLLAILALASGMLVISWITGRPSASPIAFVPGRRPTGSGSRGSETEVDLKGQWERIKNLPGAMGGPLTAVPTDKVPGIEGDETPMIAHAAELAITTKEFAHSRSLMEEILERHHGYAVKLRMVGQPAGSTLTATLRVPSSEFGAAVVDLKTLGNVEREEQTADEISEQRADLEARLRNAQQSLARLQGILAKGGKVTDLAQAERQLATLSAEIARLEAARVAAEHRMIFAQVLFSLRQEVTTPAESFAAQFRNAALGGFSEALSSLSGIAIFAISRGPVILLWVVLIYFPVRWAWRKWQPAVARGPETSEIPS